MKMPQSKKAARRLRCGRLWCIAGPDGQGLPKGSVLAQAVHRHMEAHAQRVVNRRSRPCAASTHWGCK